VTAPVAERGSARQRSQGIGRAAVLMAFLTVVVLTDGGDLRAVVRRVVRA
jgi:hypothetical protein